MSAMDDLNASIDNLINSVQAEVKRVTVDLQNSRPTDSQGIQDAIGKLNALTAQLDAVDPAALTSGIPVVVAPTNVTPENPVVPTDGTVSGS